MTRLTDQERQPISGMCVVITNPDGDVVASHADFERGGYGGYSLQEAQEMRARNMAKGRFAANHLNGWLSKDMDGYFIDQFWRNAERAGYRMSTIAVARGAEDAA